MNFRRLLSDRSVERELGTKPLNFDEKKRPLKKVMKPLIVDEGNVKEVKKLLR